MPNMTGLELAERLHANCAGIPILLISGLLSPAIVARAGELGINRVLEKPPAEEDLLARRIQVRQPIVHARVDWAETEQETG